MRAIPAPRLPSSYSTRKGTSANAEQLRQARQRGANLLKETFAKMATEAFAEAGEGAIAAVGVGLSERWLPRLRQVSESVHSQRLTSDLNTIGKQAQKVMIEAYSRLVVGHEAPADASHYRAGSGRLAGGVLLRALSRGDFFEVSGTTLVWGNFAVLDAAARHWHRIAAGAAPEGSGIADRFEVHFEDLVFGYLGLVLDPSKPFNVPPGVWKASDGQVVGAGAHPRGTDEFYPVRGGTTQSLESKRGLIVDIKNRSAAQNGINLQGGVRPGQLLSRRSRGIRSHDFFAPALAFMAIELPKAFVKYANGLLEEWNEEGHVSEVIDVKVVAGSRTRR